MKAKILQLLQWVTHALSKGKYAFVGKLTYHHNHLATSEIGIAWWDSDFHSAYLETAKIVGWKHPGPWRLYLVWHFFEEWLLEDDSGVYVEFGVDKGFTTLFCLILARKKNFSFQKKKIFLFDSFEGIRLSELSETDEYEYAHMSNQLRYVHSSYDKCVESFSGFPNVEVVKGWLPEAINSVESLKYRLIHLDLNSSVAEVSVLTMIDPVLTTDTVILLDDYNWIGRIKQKQAADQWATENGYGILSLPMGTGIMRKRK